MGNYIGGKISTRQPPGLKRALGLTLVVLYGLGVTIGAGIYVLIGATAGQAGIYAPVSFCIAALVMAPTAASFAELSTRMPVSAGEAAYVREGLNSRGLALAVGLLVVTAGAVSAAAVAIGAAGYIAVFLDAPAWLIITLVVILVIAYFGVRSDRLGQFLRSHLAAAKLAMALLFLGLGILVLLTV